MHQPHLFLNESSSLFVVSPMSQHALCFQRSLLRPNDTKKTTTRITTTTKTNNKCTSNWLIQEYRWIRQKLRHRSRLTDDVDATMLIMTLMMMKLNLLLDSPERKTQTVYLSTQLVYPLCGYVFVLIVCNYISRDKLTLCCVHWLLLFFALLL